MNHENVDYPEYHYQGMGCGLEDRGITDRYEACQYGWDEAIERCVGEVVEPLLERITELEVMERFVGYLLDNCEREVIYEESLQYWLSEMLRKEKEKSE